MGDSDGDDDFDDYGGDTDNEGGKVYLSKNHIYNLIYTNS